MIDPAAAQKKSAEIQFFDRHAEQGDYNVFTDAASRKIIDAFVSCTGLAPPARIVDLGCGSGAFTRLLSDAGFAVEGVDLSPRLVALARRMHPHIAFAKATSRRFPSPTAPSTAFSSRASCTICPTRAAAPRRCVASSSRAAGSLPSTRIASIRSCIFTATAARRFTARSG